MLRARRECPTGSSSRTSIPIMWAARRSWRGCPARPCTRAQLDYEICERAWTGEASERSVDHLLEHGMPEDEARTVLGASAAAESFVHYAHEPERLEPGETVGGWRSSTSRATPTGISASFATTCCSPATRCSAGSRRTSGSGPPPRSTRSPPTSARSSGSPSSHQASALRPRRADLDPAGRAQEIAEHHADRLERTRAALGGRAALGLRDLPDAVPDALAPSLRRFALAETLAHLEHLVLAGQATRVAENGRIAYTVG